MTNQELYNTDSAFKILADKIQACHMMISSDLAQAMEFSARLLCVGRFEKDYER